MSTVTYSMPSAVGAYSQTALASGGRGLLFVAGQLSVDADGETIGVGSFHEQFNTVFRNLRAALETSDSTLSSVLKFTTYLVDSRLIPEFYAERERLYAEIYPQGSYPPNTLLVVDRLVREEFLIEIEAVAVAG